MESGGWMVEKGGGELLNFREAEMVLALTVGMK